MSKLILIPNEVKGYRIRPDQWNWTVVVVKIHGKDSKNAGEEYDTPLGYCKSLPFAVDYLMRTVSALEGRKEQDSVFATTGVVADAQALQKGFEKASQFVMDAIHDLEKRLIDNGYNLQEINKKLRQKEVGELETTK